MLKFGTGFDWMVTSTNARAALAQWGWYGFSQAAAPPNYRIVTPGRFGGKALEMDNSSTAGGEVQASYLITNYEYNRWYQGAALFTPATSAYLGQFIGIGFNGVCLFCVMMKQFGVLELWRGRPQFGGVKIAQSAGGSYYNDTWNYIEIGGLVIGDMSGWVTVKVNTVPVIEVVSENTNPTGTLPYFNSFMIGQGYDINVGGGVTGLLWDDMYLVDNQGPDNNTWLGNIRVQSQSADGPGDSTMWDPYPSPPNWQRASNPLVDDSAYVSSSDPDDLDLYTLTPIINSPHVYGVSVRGAYRQTDATQRFVQNTIKSGVITEFGEVYATPGTYAFKSDIFERDPATDLPWLYQDVNLLQIGPHIPGVDEDFLDVGGGDHLDVGSNDRLVVD